MQRPDPSEYNEYYRTYTDQVPDGDVFEILEDGLRTTRELLAGVDRARQTYAYAPGKWTLNEVVGHVIDIERVFGFRAFCFARAEPAALPSADQDLYARTSGATRREMAALLDEFEHVRRSHLALFRSIDEATSLRRGVASGVEFTIRSLAYIVAGHEIHHRRVIEERYLV